jgi:hypothetical protein
MNICRNFLLLVLSASSFALIPSHAVAQEADLLAAYAMQPQGYPTGKEYARPDTNVPFRWHFYHDDAIESFAEAKMLPHVDSFNPLEDQGVTTERDSPVKWYFVSQHATEGDHALQVDFPAETIRLKNAGEGGKAKSATSLQTLASARENAYRRSRATRVRRSFRSRTRALSRRRASVPTHTSLRMSGIFSCCRDLPLSNWLSANNSREACRRWPLSKTSSIASTWPASVRRP